MPLGKGSGREGKLNPQLIKEIVSYIREGVKLRAAGHLAGVSYTTMSNWLDRGQLEIPSVYHDLYVSVRHAEAALQERLVKKWVDKLEDEPDGYKGLSQFLERRFPQEWGKALEINAQVSTDVSKSDEFQKLLATVEELLTPEQQLELSKRLSDESTED